MYYFLLFSFEPSVFCFVYALALWSENLCKIMRLGKCEKCFHQNRRIPYAKFVVFGNQTRPITKKNVVVAAAADDAMNRYADNAKVAHFYLLLGARLRVFNIVRSSQATDKAKLDNVTHTYASQPRKFQSNFFLLLSSRHNIYSISKLPFDSFWRSIFSLFIFSLKCHIQIRGAVKVGMT